MKRTCYAFGVLLVFLTPAACDGQEPNALREAGVRLNEDRLFAYADEHLPKNDCAARVASAWIP